MTNGATVDLLVINDGDSSSCLYGRCSYGNCLLSHSDTTIYCPIHGCVYHHLTGDILEGPTLYSLRRLPMRSNEVSVEHLSCGYEFRVN